MTIVTVDPLGGSDFTSIQAALDAAPATLTEIYEVQLVPTTYSGNFVVPSRLGESFTNYIKLTHTPLGRATAFGNGAHITAAVEDHIFTIDANFFFIEGISATLSTFGISNEVFRINGDNFLAQFCFLQSTNILEQQDCFFIGQGDPQTARAVSCAIRGFGRTAFFIQVLGQSLATEKVLELYHNTIVDCATAQVPNVSLSASGVAMLLSSAAFSALDPEDILGNVIAYNNIVANTAGYSTIFDNDLEDPSPGSYRVVSPPLAFTTNGLATWDGSGNTSHQDALAVEQFGAGSFGDVLMPTEAPTFGANIHLTNLVAGDYTIETENAFTVSQLGVVIPEPSDPRVILNIDLLGLPRPVAGSIGAFHFGEPVVPPVIPPTVPAQKTTSGSTDFCLNGLEIVDQAFSKIGVKRAEQALQPEELQDGLTALNLMVKAWQSQGGHLWARQEGVLFLDVGTTNYLLGPSGDQATNLDDFIGTSSTSVAASGSTVISVLSSAGMAVGDRVGVELDGNIRFWTTISDVSSQTSIVVSDSLPSASAFGSTIFTFTDLIERPLRITSYRRMTFGQDNEIEVIKWSRNEYFNQVNKQSTGTVVNAYYSPLLTNGRVYVWQTASSPRDFLRFSFDRNLEDFDSSGNGPDFPIEWVETIVWNLAARLGIDYNAPQAKQQIIMLNANSMLEGILGFDQEYDSINLTPDFG